MKKKQFLHFISNHVLRGAMTSRDRAFKKKSYNQDGND